MCSRANQLWDITFFQIIFANLATKPLISPKTTRIRARMWKTATLKIVWWYEQTVSNLPRICSYSRATVQTLQRELLLFLVLFRVIDSSSTTELISTSSCYTLYFTEFCNHWMQKYLPVLNENANLSSTTREKAEYGLVSVDAPKAKGETNA